LNAPENRPIRVVAGICAPRLFELGHIVATPGALDTLDHLGINATTLLVRHERGDWGAVSPEDAAANSRAVRDGDRLLSAYDLGKGKERLWIITEADRTATTILLPEEY
jgi:hypothetical protein